MIPGQITLLVFPVKSTLKMLTQDVYSRFEGVKFLKVIQPEPTKCLTDKTLLRSLITYRPGNYVVPPSLVYVWKECSSVVAHWANYPSVTWVQFQA